MNQETSKRGKTSTKKQKSWRKWQKVVAALACVVTFSTTYALILPGVTLENSNNAALEQSGIHEHTDECYTETEKLICGLEESEGHEHTSDCYTEQQGALICTNEEEDHEHTSDCYEWETILTCTEEEGEGGHTHTEDCYETERTLTCDKETGQAETTEPAGEESEIPDSEAAEETESPDTAASEDNTETVPPADETDAASGTENEQAPDSAEAPAADTDGTDTNTAANAANTDENIPDTELQKDTPLIPENEKAEQEALYAAGEKTYKDDHIEITVSYDEQAKIPEDAEFLAEKLENDTDDGADEETVLPESYQYKIGFYVDGEEIEPESTVSLNVRFLSGEFADAEGVQVIHYKTDGTETIETETETDEDGNVQAKFDMDSFSIVEFQAIGGAETLDVSVSGTTISMEVGDTHSLTDHTYQSSVNYYGQNRTSSSSNTKVAALSINNNGTATITAVGEGTATVTLYYMDNRSSDRVEYTVNVTRASGMKTISFSGNGGSGSVQSITAESGQEITFPENGFSNGSKVFVGWSTDASANEAGHNTATIYQPGNTYTVESSETFYAIWADLNVTADFFIKLNGVPATEPRTATNDNANYTWGVQITGALVEGKFYADSTGVDSNIANYPSAQNLADLINNAIYRGVSVTGVPYGVVVENGKLYNTDMYGNATNEELYVVWYVTKNADGGPLTSATPGETKARATSYVTGCNWHVDGVLMSSAKVALYYLPNAPTGVYTNFPDGSSWDAGDTVKVGNDSGNNNNCLIPSRSDGYNFVGWKMYTRDEDGNFTVTDDENKIYATGDEFVITEDTRLVAQWTKGTNFLTVKKTDMSGTVLQGATFTLEAKDDTTGTWTTITSQTTGTTGEFTYQNMENQTLYRMTETYAPNGYETRNSFYFMVTVDSGSGEGLYLYLCDEAGNVLTDAEKPDWVEIDYKGAEEAGGSGVAQLNITIQDEQIKRNVTFKKTDDAGKPLQGATFKLTDAGGGVVLITQESNENGIFSVDSAALAYGTYTLEEIEAPAGYTKADKITFTVNDYVNENENGISVTSGNMDVVCTVTESIEDNMATTTYSYVCTVQNTYAPEIRVLKKDTAQADKTLSGAEFELYSATVNGETWVKGDKLNETVLCSDENGSLTLGKLSSGTYLLYETKAPDGYNLLSEPIRITVDSTERRVSVYPNPGNITSNPADGSYTITVYNSSGVTLPNTGGPGTLAYTFGGLVMIMSCLMYGYRLRRKNGRRFMN